MVEVVRADLEQLVAGSRAQPLGEPRVVRRPRRLREARVRDVTDEDVLEAIRLLIGEGRLGLVDDEIAQLEVVERVLDALPVREVLDRAGPEAAADYRRPLQRRLRHRVESVDARCDQRLQRVRDPGGGPLLAELGHRQHDLLEEERIAFGLGEQGAARLWRELVATRERVDQLLAVGRTEGLELDRRRADAASAPVRADVEQLRPGETDDQQRPVLHPVGHVLDQLEERILGPVDVLEDEDERLRLRHQLPPLARRPRDLLLAALAVDCFEDAARQAEQVGHRLRRAAVAKLLDRDVERIVVGDVGRALHHLGQGPVGDALAVREAAALEDGRAFERGEELVHHAALADARLSVDGEEMRAPVADGPGERVLEELDLVVPPDERRDRDPCRRAAVGADRDPDPDGLLAAPDLDGADIVDLDPAERQPVHARADQDLTGISDLLQSRSEIDGLAGGEGRVAGAGDDLACLDADARLELEVLDRDEDLQRRANGPLGVVLVCRRNAERSHHGVARELLDGAAVGLDTAGNAVEELGHAPPHDLGVAGRDQRRRVDEVDEKDRGELTFHASIVETILVGQSFRGPYLEPQPTRWVHVVQKGGLLCGRDSCLRRWACSPASF